MEQNQFDLLEEVEQDIVVEDKKTELKEYEKLLLLERDRKDYEKALNLVKFGCFEQKEETTVDFNCLEKNSSTKKYRGLYSLYRNVETMQLMFICPLVEDNKGDKDERKDLKPYAYDVIYLEVMDNETYQMVIKAAKNNIKNAIPVVYRTSIVLYFVNIVAMLSVFIYHFIMNANNGGGFANAFFLALYYTSNLIVGFLVATFLLVLIMIKYRKYKEE